MGRVTNLEERVEWGDAAGDPFIEWPKHLPYAVLLPATKLSPRQLLELTKVLYFGSLNLLHLQKIFLEAPRVLVKDFYPDMIEEISEVLRREGILHEIVHAELINEPSIAQGFRWKPGSWKERGFSDAAPNHGALTCTFSVWSSATIRMRH